MKIFQKSKAILLLVALLGFSIVKISVQASEIQPYWDKAEKVSTELTIFGETATSTLRVVGKPGTSQITGTLKLVDNTTGTTVDKWSISKSSTTCTEVKSSTVTAGHKFTLSFSGYVYDANGRGEYVSASDSK